MVITEMPITPLDKVCVCVRACVLQSSNSNKVEKKEEYFRGRLVSDRLLICATWHLIKRHAKLRGIHGCTAVCLKYSNDICQTDNLITPNSILPNQKTSLLRTNKMLHFPTVPFCTCPCWVKERDKKTEATWLPEPQSFALDPFQEIWPVERDGEKSAGGDGALCHLCWVL